MVGSVPAGKLQPGLAREKGVAEEEEMRGPIIIMPI
jgi:hypothetical protein